MSFLLRDRLYGALRLALILFVLIYFVYHMTQGERGILSWIRLRHTINEAETQLTDLQKTRETLEKRVRLLHPQSLDKDMLEERARVVLNFADKEEVVIQGAKLSK